MSEEDPKMNGTLEEFLAAWKKPPEPNPSARLKELLSSDDSTTNRHDEPSTDSSSQLAEEEAKSEKTASGTVQESQYHCCHICKDHFITETPSDREIHAMRPWFAGSFNMSLKSLIQGLEHNCELVRLIFSLINCDVPRSGHKSVLLALKKDEDESKNIRSVIDYINWSKGVDVTIRIAIDNRPVGSSGRLFPSFELIPRLPDHWINAGRINSTFFYMRLTNDSKMADGYIEYEPSFAKDDKDPKTILHSQVPLGACRVAGFDLARRCLQDCVDNHRGICQRVTDETSLLPTRVIDIGTRYPIRSVRLHWSDEGETADYSVLSYCWGGYQGVSTTHETAQDFTDGIVFSKLPKTLQDAVTTTYELGLRYIWIDRLCIIQDSAEDVAREMAKMADIFDNAYVTISAASAKTITDGFLYTRDEIPTRLSLHRLSGENEHVYFQLLGTYDAERNPISLRAWTLQEHILSRRILMYSNQGLLWTCNVNNLLEGRENNIGERNLHPTRGDLHTWRTTLQDYTRRFMTYSHDKLPAIAGIAAGYSKRFESAYLAGLWEFAFLEELLWSSKRGDITRPAVQRAPSWSWASVDGEICHDWREHGQDSLTVISCLVAPLSADFPFGRVDPLRSMLRVEGYLGLFYWSEGREMLSVALDRPREDAHKDTDYVNVAKTQADAVEMIPANGDGKMEVWGLVVKTAPARGLVLISNGDDKYRRIGMFSEFMDEQYVPTERKVISII